MDQLSRTIFSAGEEEWTIDGIFEATIYTIFGDILRDLRFMSDFTILKTAYIPNDGSGPIVTKADVRGDLVVFLRLDEHYRNGLFEHLGPKPTRQWIGSP